MSGPGELGPAWLRWLLSPTGIPALFLRYTSAGAVGTAAHYLVLVVLVSGLAVPPVLGTATGFLSGAMINYWLNFHHTFRSTRRHRDAAPRFLALAFLGFLLNTGIVAIGTAWLGLPYLVPQLVATGLVLISTFAGNRLWTFGVKSHG